MVWPNMFLFVYICLPITVDYVLFYSGWGHHSRIPGIAIRYMHVINKSISLCNKTSQFPYWLLIEK